MPISTGYSAIVATGQQLFITQRNGQTQLTITTTAPGQQQSQSSSLATGEWRSPPALYCTSSGVVLQIFAQQQDIWLQLQGQQMQAMTSAPTVMEADRVTLEPTEAPSVMQPMQPMEMGDMEMKPMQMKMGDMEMSMGKPDRTTKFCSQCGQPVEASDRFCTQCGHSLS
ncbi:zinc-ribbon domain-containing protein [Microcoleus sp. FACHB-1515]|uniref:zinc-ribbon domain-containing protein n=1 Tax=Cyanophyceae TaxID=3028117 RepID=UPI001687AD2D|nr:zinc ribbon domain-containing protein [Microcoleus sp. FACHB-1515]MBD2089702.1 zinc-ribbon domain-containing protein [Microcoleus sp. FACHB-1515]